MIECHLDNCPHHLSKHKPEYGPYCYLVSCAWDEPTMGAYLKAVRNKHENPEDVLPIGEGSCNNSQEGNT